MGKIKKNVEKLRKAIIITSVICITIVLIILIIIGINIFKSKTQLPEDKEVLERGNHIPTSFEKQIVTNHSTFFSVGDAIQKYLNSISFDLEEISSKPVRGSKKLNAATLYAQDQGIVGEESKKEAIYNFLNPKYISDNSISVSNVLDKVYNNEKVEFIPLKMYELLGNIKSQYAVYGIMQNMNSKDQKQVYFIVDVDKINNSFYITPIDFQKYQDVDEIPLETKDENIELNKNNLFSFSIMQENEIAQKYFTYYKNLMLENPETAYEMLEEEYRNKRFGNVDEFKNYITKNQEEIKSYLAKEYIVNSLEDGTEYICQDQYKRSYIFKVSAVMQFKVKLDTYTIESEETKQRYQAANERRKVEMNVDKWIQMLNHRDYKAAYNVLDEGFKAQYFQDLNSFEEYMRNKFPYYYGINLSDFSNEAGFYIQKILMTDITAKIKMTIPETIIMKLTEEGFIMSFRVLS